jgi:hypothetical protein
MLNWLNKLSASISKRLSGKKAPALFLQTSIDGLAIELGEEKKFVPWSSVDQVTVFKRDQVTVDMICMLISAEGKIIELNETMNGWSEASSALETHLPGSMPWAEWTLKVMFPAFATNAIDIYNKGVSSATST